MTVENLKQFTKELEKKITFNTENLYIHYIYCKGGHYTSKLNFWIINNNAFDMSIADIQKYIKDNFTFPNSSQVSGNAYGMPCSGFVANNIESQIKPVSVIGWSTADNKFVCLQDTTGAMPTAYLLPELTLQGQKTITLALNNANKPSYKTYTTNLTYTGSKIGDIKWTCYKYPLGDGKFKYEWSASGSGSANITWAKWSSSVSWSYYVGLVTANLPTDYEGYTNIKNNLICNMHLEGIYTNQMLSLNATNVQCYFERPDSGSNRTKTIRFTAQADYIANS